MNLEVVWSGTIQRQAWQPRPAPPLSDEELHPSKYARRRSGHGRPVGRGGQALEDGIMHVLGKGELKQADLIRAMAPASGSSVRRVLERLLRQRQILAYRPDGSRRNNSGVLYRRVPKWQPSLFGRK